MSRKVKDKGKKGNYMDAVEQAYAQCVGDLIDDLERRSHVVDVTQTGVYSVRATLEDGSTMEYALQYQPKKDDA